MPSNERQNKRNERQRQKEKKNKTVIWIVLIIILAGLIIMKVCEINFSTLKDTLYSNTSISKVQDEIYPYSLDGFDTANLSVVNDKLNILTNSSLIVLNPTDAKELNNIQHNYSNPIMSKAGNYICIIDQGATRLRLDTTSDNKFEKNLKKRIITADVAANGNVAYATLADESKSTIEVISKTTAQKAKIDVNDGYVTSIAINSAGSKLAYATVNSKDAKLITAIHTINVGATEDTAAFDLESSNLLDLHFSNSGNCYVICDDAVYVISSQKKLTDVYKKGTISTISYAYTDTNELILNYAQYSDSIQNDVSYIKSNGKIKSTVRFDKRVKSISSSSNKMTVLLDDKIKVYSLSKGEEKAEFDCRSDASCAYTLSSKHFILYGQNIDVIE